MFDNSFNPVGAASKVPVEPATSKPAALSDNTAPSSNPVPEEKQVESIKTEPTSPLTTEAEKESQDVPVKNEPATSVCAKDESEAKASTGMAACGTKEDTAVKLGGGDVGVVKLGKRSAGDHATVEQILEEMAKGKKHEGVEAHALNKVAKIEPPEKAPKPKREKRYIHVAILFYIGALLSLIVLFLHHKIL